MYIKRVVFRNCQSLRNLEYEFTAGLNVIVAPDNDGNSTGKSIFFKCLRTAIGADFFDDSELVHLISYGQTVASALFEMSDGSAGGFLASGHSLIYLYRETVDSPIERLTAPHPEFIMKMSIIMDVKNKFVLNILDTNQELLFVTSKEDTNFSLLNLISDNETMEEIIPVIEGKMSDIRAYLSKATMISVELKRKLNSFERVNIPHLEQQLRCGERLIPISNQLVDIYDILSSVQPRRVEDLDLRENFLGLADYCMTLSSKISQIGYGAVVSRDFRTDERLLQFARGLNNMFILAGSVVDISPVCFKEYLSLCGLGTLLSDIAESTIHYRNKGKKWNECLLSIDEIEREMKDIMQCSKIVTCPVKGKVIFSSDGKCEECGDMDEVYLHRCD